ncbi:MAG: RsmB/NOP family class I SAM-dependent RNA methyltransferase, partial [Nocardioidaceae bacterium]
LDRVAPGRDADPLGDLAVRHSHPRWIVQAFRDALDGDLAETEAALAADNTAPGVTLVARPGRSDGEELTALGARPARLSPYAFHLPAGDPGRLAPVREGRAGVQDEGSQLVALALAGAPLDGPDGQWLDLCAGPGGKAALLAALASQHGADLLANELQPHRAELVAQALRLQPNARVRTGDGRVADWAPGSFDRALVDAPCTGLGALRRRPEARWRRTEADLETLTGLQVELLGAALDAVRAGGVVAYATCSPHLAETRGAVDAVLDRREDVEPIDTAAVLDSVLAPGPGPAGPDVRPGVRPGVQLWPHRHDTDAMFVALLRRL